MDEMDKLSYIQEVIKIKVEEILKLGNSLNLAESQIKKELQELNL